MVHYVIKRVLQAIIVLILVSLVMFALLHSLPGGLVRAQLGPKASSTAVAHLTKQEGLTKPLPVQYGVWFGNLIHGNLGFSYYESTPVSTLLGEYLPRDLLLAGLALLFTVLISIPLGILQGSRRNRLDDYAVSGALLTVYSMPTFLLGVVLIEIFALSFHLLPSEAQNFGQNLGTDVQVLVLPVATLTIGNIAYFSRFVRSSVIDNYLEEYVRTARAKGASSRRILFGHVMRNSLLPFVSVVGISLPTVVSGALLVEVLFDYPGMGLLFWTAEQHRTYPLLLGIVLLLSVVVVLCNLLADLAYGVMDPRVRYD